MLLLVTTANANTAMGHHALILCTGHRNSAVGAYAMDVCTSGNDNSAIGVGALGALTGGSENAACGRSALGAVTTGSYNVALGYNAGGDITTGDDNVCIGDDAGVGQVTTTDGDLYIARSNTAAGNSATWIAGNSSGTCYQGDNTTTWSTVSDRRLKKNITDNNKGLDEINQLRVTNFEYRLQNEIDMSEFPLADGPHQVVLGGGKEGQVQTGVIAQEIESVLPECIVTSARGAKTVNTDPITWAMVNAIKELSTKNDELAAEIASLKSQINN